MLVQLGAILEDCVSWLRLDAGSRVAVALREGWNGSVKKLLEEQDKAGSSRMQWRLVEAQV